MNILVLGATSNIGYFITLELCRDNYLILVGRNVDKIKELQKLCYSYGATGVEIYCNDISKDFISLLDTTKGKNIDLILNSISSISRLRDNHINSGHQFLKYYLDVDLYIPIYLISEIAKGNKSVLKVLFISSILSKVATNDRNFYSSIKKLFEISLINLAIDKKIVTKIIYIGKVFSYNEQPDIKKYKKLALFVKKSFDKKKTRCIYGIGGYFFLLIFYINPALLIFLNKIQRMFRQIL